MDDSAPFSPPGGAWQRLSPKYVTVRRLGSLIGTLSVFVPVGVASWFIFRLWWVTAIVAAVALVWFVWRWIRSRRWVEAWGFAERDADLCIRRGLMFRELLVVPFGRMQMVKVSSGPLLKAHGLAQVELVTASPQTDATIPGLPAEQAAQLRDRLIELSDAKGSGL